MRNRKRSAGVPIPDTLQPPTRLTDKQHRCLAPEQTSRTLPDTRSHRQALQRPTGHASETIRPHQQADEAIVSKNPHKGIAIGTPANR